MIDHETFSSVILSLLIHEGQLSVSVHEGQLSVSVHEGQLSVSGERMCTNTG